MEPINVLITTPIGDEGVHCIAAVSHVVKLIDVSALVRAEQKGDSASKKELDNLLAETDVLYGLRLPRGVTARAPRLKWVQVMSAGVERFLDDDFRQSSVIMTNVKGIHAIPIGEFVLGLMLMFVKGAPLSFELKQRRQWQRFTPAVLYSKTVGIVGFGNIGREVARLAKTFNMRVVAIRRSVEQGAPTGNVDMLLPSGQLPCLLSESDFVVLALPLTPETERLIGEAELRRMRSTAYLINVSRGGIVDEEALVRGLEEHWIAGAGLDVFATEPLPAESKLWQLSNVIFSPHIAGGMEDYSAKATDIFCENLRRYLNKSELLNVVDKEKGY